MDVAPRCLGCSDVALASVSRISSSAVGYGFPPVPFSNVGSRIYESMAMKDTGSWGWNDGGSSSARWGRRVFGSVKPGLSCRFRVNVLKKGIGEIADLCCRKQSFSPEIKGNGGLEFEILRFMQKTSKPNSFPTKEEFLASGRGDLVKQIVAEGGWLVSGWDVKSIRSGPHQVDVGASEGNSKSESQRSSSPSSVARKNLSKENAVMTACDDDKLIVKGVHGTMPSVRRVRGKGKVVRHCVATPLTTAEYMSLPASSLSAGDACFSNEDFEVKHGIRQGAPIYTEIERERDALLVRGTHSGGNYPKATHSKNAGHVVPITSSNPALALARNTDDLNGSVKHTKGRISRSKIKENKKGKEIVLQPTSKHICSDGNIDWTNGNQRGSWKLVEDSFSMGGLVTPAKPTPTSVQDRIRTLEDKLLAARSALRSGREALIRSVDNLSQVDDNALVEELVSMSEALEFRENDIMKARADLRTTRAEVAAVQGKLETEILEAHKLINQKEKQIEKAKLALRTLRTARIVWPNYASEVLLTGSFNGWTSQIKMNKSSAGVFIATLQLYPGLYEIKFVVDGSWRVDPNRTVVYRGGYENNLVTIL